MPLRAGTMKASKQKNSEAIGFPSGMLNVNSCRLSVLYNDDSLVAIEKPSGIPIRPHAWYTHLPNLSTAIRQQQGKPELKRLGIPSSLFPIFALEAECSGLALFAKSKEQARFYRNQYGSRQLHFTFTFLATEVDATLQERKCDLPLARHYNCKRMLVSHKSGKHCQTAFRRIEPLCPPYGVWEARTDYYRFHQIRLHAYESGLTVLGESLYALQPIPRSKPWQGHQNFNADSRENGAPSSVSSFPCQHLSSLELKSMEGLSIMIESPLPKRLQAIVKQMHHALR